MKIQAIGSDAVIGNDHIKGCWTEKEGKWDYHEGNYWDNIGFSQTMRHPVACVSHNDAIAFVNWLNKRSGQLYRLPTEAEWEYAARGGKETIFFWGDKVDNRACEYVNGADNGSNWKNYFPCYDGYQWSSPVGSFKPNGYGLHDMLGNVWEWCQDWYDENYYRSSPRNNPEGPLSGSYRMIRGGSWYDHPGVVRAAFRYMDGPEVSVSYFGFRLIRAVQR